MYIHHPHDRPGAHFFHSRCQLLSFFLFLDTIVHRQKISVSCFCGRERSRSAGRAGRLVAFRRGHGSTSKGSTIRERASMFPVVAAFCCFSNLRRCSTAVGALVKILRSRCFEGILSGYERRNLPTMETGLRGNIHTSTFLRTYFCAMKRLV